MFKLLETFPSILKYIAIGVLLLVLYWKKDLLAALITGNTSNILDEISKNIDTRLVTLTAQELQTCAETLNNSFGMWNDSETDIYLIFNMLQNIHDLNALIVVCGLKDNQTIITQLRDNLNQTERQTINSILSDKNISYEV
jgi:hypothetical protein